MQIDRARQYCLLLIGMFICAPLFSQENWWMEEPIRLVQTNLRETDSDLDPVALAEQIENFPANTVLFGMGGIRAHYQTRVDNHIISDYLPEGKDLVAEMIHETHKRGMRFIGRFDFSRTEAEIYTAHPDWFILRPDGSPVKDHNGLHTTCINGGYYREHIFKILEEALTVYELDGVFFNWFGNHRFSYSGKSVGVCQCAGCQDRYDQMFKKDLPLEYNDEYSQFMYSCTRKVASEISALVDSLRPECMMVTYITQHVDATSSESDTYIWRPTPLWHYSASENVNRVRNTNPHKMSLNYVMPYVAMNWRYAATSGAGIQRRLYQAMAQGAFPAFVVLGTYDTQWDHTAVNAARPVFQWHKQNEELYVNQQNQGRVLLVAEPHNGSNSGSYSYKGFYRLLSETHIPFIVSDKVSELLSVPGKFDLVIIPEKADYPGLDRYIRNGGKVLIAGTTRPSTDLPAEVKLWEETGNSYLHIENHQIFPSLKRTEVLFLTEKYLELEEVDHPYITLIPPTSYSPPEKVSRLSERTNKPGLILKDIGKGRLAYIPWDVGSLYYKYSNDNHRLFVSDLIDHLIQGERQIMTNAHPLVEMEDIKIEIKGKYGQAYSHSLKRKLGVSFSDGYTQFHVPYLEAYDVISIK